MGRDKRIRIIFSILVCVSILFSLLTVTPQSVFGEVSHADDSLPRIVRVTNDFSFIGIVKPDEQISLNLQKNFSTNSISFNAARLFKIIFSFCIKILILLSTFSGSYLVLSLTTTRSQKIIIRYIQSVNGQ